MYAKNSPYPGCFFLTPIGFYILLTFARCNPPLVRVCDPCLTLQKQKTFTSKAQIAIVSKPRIIGGYSS